MRPHLRRAAAGRVHATLAVTVLVALLHGSALAQGQPANPQPTPQPGADAEAEGFFREPWFIERSLKWMPLRIRLTPEEGRMPKDGFYPELANMPTGAGWISAGPGYRRSLFGGLALVDASAALSWRSYKMAQARFELPKLAAGRVTAGSQIRWQDLTQVTYFGAGPAAPEADRSEYRLKSTNVVGYASVRPRQWLSIGGRFGWLDRPAILPPAGSFKRDNPDTAEVFPEDIVYTIAEQPSFLHGDVSVSADTRDHRSHPTRGGLYRAAWTGYSDRDTGTFSFRRYEAEGAQFVPLSRDRVVLAFHGWLVASDTGPGNVVPFYLLPSLGGNSTVRAYTDYRFHDRNLLVLNAETRVALFTHLDAAVFVDAGNVAARVGDLNLDKRGYGVGLRMHTRRSTFARFDVAHGDEGWRFLFRLTDPLHLSRLSRRTAAIPFVP